MLAYDRLRLMNLFHNSRRVMLCFQIARRRRLRQYIVSAVYRRNVIWLTRPSPHHHFDCCQKQVFGH